MTGRSLRVQGLGFVGQQVWDLDRGFIGFALRRTKLSCR